MIVLCNVTGDPSHKSLQCTRKGMQESRPYLTQEDLHSLRLLPTGSNAQCVFQFASLGSQAQSPANPS